MEALRTFLLILSLSPALLAAPKPLQVCIPVGKDLAEAMAELKHLKKANP